MASIGCNGSASAEIRRILPNKLWTPYKLWTPSARIRPTSRLFAVILTAATLAACAQSPVITGKPASLAGNRDVSPQPARTASSLANRRVVVVPRKHTPYATAKRPPSSTDGSSGLASYYGHGEQTASGEKFDARELTAAHRTLPFGTKLRVTNVDTGQSVTVRVNDRGPFIPGRVVDVSSSAAETLGLVGRGVAKVKLDVVD